MNPDPESPHRPCNFAARPDDPYYRAEQLENEITELCAHLTAATYRLLTLILALDREKPWGAWGLNSCAHWLNWKCGIGLVAAREKVRVALALEGLPRICEVFRKGEVSYSKVRAMTRVATPENEEYLLMIAAHGTAAHVEKLVRAYGGVERREELRRVKKQYAKRTVSYYTDDDGSVVIKARLPAEEAALVLKALKAGAEALRKEARSAESRPGNDSAESSEANEYGGFGVVEVSPEFIEETDTHATREADALVAMAETSLQSDPRPLSGGDRYQVVVHVDAETLVEGGDGRCELEDGPWLAAETVRRLGCDASLVTMLEDGDGETLNVGRKTRSIPPSIARALQVRDQGCRFPGCTNRRYVDGHHVHHWADGGETRLDNLVQLCRVHHRLVHEGGFQVERNDSAEARFIFRRPDGRVIDPAPTQRRGRPPTPEALRARNVALGLDINHRTGVTRWDGQPMDYHMAVDGLLARRDGGSLGTDSTSTRTEL